MADIDPSLDTPPWEDDPDAAAAAERDLDTDDMFGAPAETHAPAMSADAPVRPAPGAAEGQAPADGGAYTVLARKYRPRTFEDLIGQEAMVRTLTNAFASGRIAHAFMLTGVRGVGKTTTARLLARALNYESDYVSQPSLELAVEGRHDAAIMAGSHIDVMELDAASHNGVGDMRDILEGVRYAPLEARYKVYVLDEVHMLSTPAFNALLKTLEEPPAHAKFIFATTEIRKVPVTILSRCQRFDLRRVEPEILGPHLEAVATKEGALVDSEALALIARAAEGSVRDGLSLLDQALVQVERGQTVQAELVRDMLGLADRAQTIQLFESVMAGRTAEALEQFRTLYGFGADPGLVVGDLMEHCHAATVAKTLGPAATRLPTDQAARLAALGATLSAGTLARCWQMLLKAHEEVRRAPDPAAATEMAIVRLAYAADLPGPEEAIRKLQTGDLGGAPAGGGSGGRAPSGGGGGAQAMARPQAAPSAAPQPQSFEETVALIEARRDISLLMDVQRYVRPVSFRPGAIEFEPAPNAPDDLARRLAVRLKEWTGQPWLIAAQGGGGGESLIEKNRRHKVEERAEIERDPFVASVLAAFPGATLGEIRQLAVQSTAEPSEGTTDDPDED